MPRPRTTAKPAPVDVEPEPEPTPDLGPDIRGGVLFVKVRNADGAEASVPEHLLAHHAARGFVPADQPEPEPDPDPQTSPKDDNNPSPQED
jgi:hypothetical protein